MSSVNASVFARETVWGKVCFPKAWTGTSNGIGLGSRIAIVVPTQQGLSHDMETSLNRLALPPDNIIVVHDGYGEERVVLDHNFGDTSISRAKERMIVTHTGECKGPAFARNIGMMIALRTDAEIIAFLDDDCRPDPFWTYELVMSFIRMREASILSGMTYAIGNTEFDKTHDREGTLNGRTFIDEDFLLYGPTCNLAVTRTVANTIAFDTSYPEAACEDVDFCLRALQNGYKICHSPSMKVLHDYGYGDCCCNAKDHYEARRERYARGQKILQERFPNYWAYYEKTKEIPCKGSHLET